MDLLNLRRLRMFCEVMHTNSVSQAARRLNLTQPAVSKSLQQLENELGLVLFKRHQGRLYPSYEAEQLFADAERLFGHLDHLKRKLQGLENAREGELAIAAIPTLSGSLVARAIAKFRAERPNIRVHLRSHTAQQVVELVARQEVELGFVNNIDESASVNSTLVSEAELVCLLPKDHELGAMETIHAADLEGYPLIALGRLSPASAPIRQTLKAAGLGSAVLIETNLSSAVYALVAARAGVAIIDPLAKLSNTYSNLEIRPFRPTVRVRTECLTSRFRPLSILGAQFSQELQSVVAEIAVSSPFLSVSQPGIPVANE